MDISYFREFVALVETQSFQRASEAMFITQSALSKHIKNFERELGHSLFARTTRKLELSAFGSAFLPYARNIVETQDAYIRDLLQMNDVEEHSLSLGTASPLFEHVMNIISGFRAENPQYQVNIFDSDPPVIKTQLANRKCDAIILAETPRGPRLVEAFPIEKDMLSVVLPIHHPLASRESVELEELKDNRFILLEKGSEVYELSIKLFKNLGITPAIEFMSPSIANIFSLVERGHGVGIIASAHIPPHENVALVPIYPPVAMAVNVYYRRDNCSVALQAFLKYVKELCGSDELKAWFELNRL